MGSPEKQKERETSKTSLATMVGNGKEAKVRLLTERKWEFIRKKNIKKRRVCFFCRKHELKWSGVSSFQIAFCKTNVSYSLRE